MLRLLFLTGLLPSVLLTAFLPSLVLSDDTVAGAETVAGEEAMPIAGEEAPTNFEEMEVESDESFVEEGEEIEDVENPSALLDDGQMDEEEIEVGFFLETTHLVFTSLGQWTIK